MKIVFIGLINKEYFKGNYTFPTYGLHEKYFAYL